MRALALIAVAACGGGSAAAPAPAEAVANQREALVEAGLEVLDRGAQPWRELRYAMPVGKRQQMEMVAAIDSETPMGRMAMPTMTMLQNVEVVEVVPDGAITIRLTVTDASVTETADTAPGVTEAMAEELGKIRGTVDTLTIDATGRRLAHDGPAEVAHMPGAQATSRMYVARPRAAIGVGARWRLVQQVVLNGVNATETATYELLALTETGATVKQTTEATAEPQTLVEAGVSVDVTNLTGRGDTTSTVDFTKPVTASAGTSTLTMTLATQGQTFEMGTTIVLTTAPR